jgi:hypothetical protein
MNSKNVHYTMGPQDAIAVLRFRCKTIKYPNSLNETRFAPPPRRAHLRGAPSANVRAARARSRSPAAASMPRAARESRSLRMGEADPALDVFRFIVTKFSQPISEALRSVNLFPAPRFPREHPARERAIVSHCFACARRIVPGWEPALSAQDFLYDREAIAARVALVLDLIKRFVAAHNDVVRSNKARLRSALVAQEELRRAAVGHGCLPADETAAEEGASDDADDGAPPKPRARRTPVFVDSHAPTEPPDLRGKHDGGVAQRWLASEYFNEDELALYRDQIQCVRLPRCAPCYGVRRATPRLTEPCRHLFPSQVFHLGAVGDGGGAAGRTLMPALDSELLGLTALRALALSGVSADADDDSFEQVFSFQESTDAGFRR